MHDLQLCGWKRGAVAAGGVLGRCLCVVVLLSLDSLTPARAAAKANVAFSLSAVSGRPGQTVTLSTLVYSGGKPVSGLSVQFAVEGALVGTVTSDSSGASISYTIPPATMPALYNVTASTAGNLLFNPATRTTAALTVLKLGIAFSLYAVSGRDGHAVTLKTLVLNGGKPVSGLTVLFAVDGAPAGSGISDASGAAVSYTIPDTMAPGLYNVTVSFAGDATYDRATRTTAALTVLRYVVTLSLYAVSGQPGQVVTLKSLVYARGAPVSGLAVQFAVEGTAVGPAVSNASGASIAYTIPGTMMPGTHDVTVSFTGNSTYAPATRTTEALTVPKFTVTLSLAPAKGTPGYSVRLKSLVYSKGAPVSGLIVDFYVYTTYGLLFAGEGISDASGASCTYAVPSWMTYGPYVVLAATAGDATYKGASTTVAALTVAPLSVYLSVGPAAGTPFQTVTLSCLAFGDGGAIVGLPLKFSVDGNPVGTGVSDGKGWARVTTSAPPTNDKVHDVTVSFAGDATYGAASRTTPALTVHLGGLALGCPWPKYHGNAANSGRGLGSKATGNAKWEFSPGCNVFSSPALDGSGNAYFGDDRGNVWAVDASGFPKWGRATGGPVNSSPAIGEPGVLYVGSNDSYFYALNLADGTVQWRFEVGGPVSSSPAVAQDGTIYFGCDDAYVYALHTNGTRKWRFQTGFFVRSSPAIAADGTVYIGSCDGCVYALNPTDGSQKWKYQTGGWVSSSPAIGTDDTVFVGSADHYVYALNPADGSLKWRTKTGDAVYSSPAIGSGGTIYIGSDDCYVYALNSADGSVRWAFQTGQPVTSSPALGANNTVYAGSNDGYIYALDPADSHQIWSYSDASGHLGSSIAIAFDGSIYFGFAFASSSPFDGIIALE